MRERGGIQVLNKLLFSLHPVLVVVRVASPEPLVVRSASNFCIKPLQDASSISSKR